LYHEMHHAAKNYRLTLGANEMDTINPTNAFMSNYNGSTNRSNHDSYYPNSDYESGFARY